MKALGWERLVNRQGTTWRRLDEPVRASTVDAASARRLMLDQPSVIKRPVVEWGDGRITVGFDAGEWTAAL
jgi:arsenate reductase-like glutaredoxin family protein